MKFLRWLLAILVATTGIYYIWASANRATNDFRSRLFLPSGDSVINIGIDSGNGNLIGMQPLLEAGNYSGEGSSSYPAARQASPYTLPYRQLLNMPYRAR